LRARPRPKLRGRGQTFEAEAKILALGPKYFGLEPKYFGLEDLTSLDGREGTSPRVG